MADPIRSSPSTNAKKIKTEPLGETEGTVTAPINMPGSGRGTARLRKQATPRGGTTGGPRGGSRGGARGGGATGSRARADAPRAAGAAASPSTPIAAKTATRGRKKAPEPPAPPAPLPWTSGAHEKRDKRRFTSDDLGLLETGNFADATIICVKKEWKVHKTILCPRSKWFADAFDDKNQEGQTGIVNLHDWTEEDMDTMLRFIYSGAIDKEKFSVDKGSFVVYAKLYKIAATFQLSHMQDDALSLLGQYCDKMLQMLCQLKTAKDVGAVPGDSSDPSVFLDDLMQAIWIAYNETSEPDQLQNLLATFVYAARSRLFQRAELRTVADSCPMFGNTIFKLMLGQASTSFPPGEDAITKMSAGLDHTQKTQHPDRCAHCHDVFDEKRAKKGMFNPFAAATRPATYCVQCVKKNLDDPTPLWRIEPVNKKEKE